MGTTREHLSKRCAEEILRRFEEIWGMDRVQRHQDLGRRRFENDTFYSQITITMKSDNCRLLVTCIQKIATFTNTPFITERYSVAPDPNQIEFQGAEEIYERTSLRNAQLEELGEWLANYRPAL